MALLIVNNESNASRRVVPVSAISSNGTSPCTLEAGGQPQWMMGGVYKGNTSGTLSAASAGRGEYFVVLTASEVSLVGQGCVYYSSATALEWATPFQVIAWDSGDSVRAGLTALPNAAAAAAGGLLVFGTGSGAINPSSGSVDAQYLDLSSKLTVGVGTIKAATYSGVTVGSLATIVAGDYSSSITFGVGGIKAGTYSAVTVGSLATIVAGDYSSTITFGVGLIKPATYSGVTVGINNITAGTYSGVTVGVNNVAAGFYSGVTWSGLSTDGNQAIANSLLSTNVGNSRLVQEYLWPNRNKVLIQGSVMTVFKPDDLTSSWTASVTTGTITITASDPQG